ncbi:hypothetical protein SAMN02745857_03790 [Andreprevotia lacus DSM 23236]|jgi:hypothetical protein|uniref:Uncharacterized protein n=1 Tax=Andreprevotia lacus DSM 23236 TaxID=1121001 RepID=A0A1W1XZH5_9NEIS|nr:hypothetical protein [Andreprevotia lacus]SMC29370.1 hypothetical protein SAMN02745857_03790 [Andreprevotia lacus DSM 23236]
MARSGGVLTALVVTVAGGVAAMLVYDWVKKRQATSSGPARPPDATIQPVRPGANQWPKLDSMSFSGSTSSPVWI